MFLLISICSTDFGEDFGEDKTKSILFKRGKKFDLSLNIARNESVINGAQWSNT